MIRPLLLSYRGYCPEVEPNHEAGGHGESRGGEQD